MFVLSVKSKKLKRAAVVAVLLTLIASCAVALCVYTQNRPAAKADGASLRAGSNSERVSFLSQFGWSVYEEPLEVVEVVIPSEFDETYTRYNEIQINENGLDLTDYAGFRVKRWTYGIINYPGKEGSDGIIRANLLVYEGMVIGGDVCSVELDGFMQGFAFPESASQAEILTTAASTAAVQ